MFLESIRKFHDDRPGAVGTAIFDKDDNLAVDFVAAASNLRAANFGLALQSWFDIKVAGLSMFRVVLPELAQTPSRLRFPGRTCGTCGILICIVSALYLQVAWKRWHCIYCI